MEQIAVMIVSMLMHRLEKLTMEVMVPMRAMAVFPLVLCKSITFSDVALTSLVISQSTRNLFLCGRKTEGSTELASTSRLVTFSVAKLPWRI